MLDIDAAGPVHQPWDSPEKDHWKQEKPHELFLAKSNCQVWGRGLHKHLPIIIENAY